MKVSLNWLKTYINVDAPSEEIGKILTDCGLEVEGIETHESVKGGLKGIVIGHVVETRPHPNADKLTCCKVDVGTGNLLDIVCGAPNVAAGQKVPVATVGTVLYHGDESFTIKSAKLRGEPSEGMICAEDEIGLGTSHAGIMVLDPEAVIGTPAAGYFNIESDTVLEIAITPNRNDASSHFGVARDLAAAINNREKHLPAAVFTKPSVETFKSDDNSLPISVEIANPEACVRYMGVTLNGIKVGESPEWLKNRLNSIGLRSINNIVDITNFVLFETGQPLHAFDASAIKGNKVIVRKENAGTKFVTLDGVERSLGADDLMICNAEEGMCIGGVFGGLHSGVSENTTAIFLESATFDSTHIRKTSKLHTLKTDASFRFERGADPNMAPYALMRAALLMKEIAGGKISSGIVDVYPAPVADKVISTSVKRMQTLVGKEIPAETIIAILDSLDIKLLQNHGDELVFSVPPYRVDVTREADIVEEMLRIYGYNNIEFSTMIRSSLAHIEKPDREAVQNSLSNYLSDNGFNEMMNNSLTSVDYYEKTKFFDPAISVRILNPLSRDLEFMRQSLIFGGLESISHNINRKYQDLKFFEIGNVYNLNPENAGSEDVTKKYSEKKKLAIFITGNSKAESWYHPTAKSDYFLLKSYVAGLFTKSGIPAERISYSGSQENILSQGEMIIAGKTPLGFLGYLSKELLQYFSIKQPVLYAEIDWEILMGILKTTKTKIAELVKFPEVRRDLALVVDKSTEFSKLRSLAYKAGKEILKSVNLFDVYEGDKIASDKKSYALSFTLQSENQTLTDAQIDQFMQKLVKVYTEEAGALIRQ